MPEAHSLLLFIVAGPLLNLTPGPDVLCIVTRALRSGDHVGSVSRGMHWLERGAGALFIGFGIRLALAENSGAASSVH
ncbi:hypothetical protein [Variovorax sp. WDL1]|uniref:hypothetical protein n=1 Tax=unclassified Variovorax TaxID=663243 RepID=UPI00076C13C2|nr:hypothetical protein APY03_7557 [Variovorax sp. WDL1]PNG51847.1 hypothetical protein CHC06_04974 [Variovorax sp. B2]PNG54194.1 hypothetical protein CHC07_04023 [Variovorax sp. B4]VTV11677.1 hypothetical protein WDL1CHR_02542 [Variovorax sp. WDL1]